MTDTAEAPTAQSADEARVNAAIDALLAEHDPKTTDPFEFRGYQFDHGLAWIHFPEGFGGLGIRPELQRIVETRLHQAGLKPPPPTVFFRELAGPTIVTHGTEEAKRRFLRPMFTGEESWCQLFSEPGSGSDLAGLSTRAVKDGEEWVVNGQKVWNTMAHLADWGMLVARTDPNVPKHRGLTYFAIDMHGEGVEVRPLYQITGEAEFNEVYMTDARIPEAHRIGDIGNGWAVSMTTLMNERTSIGGGGGGRPAGSGPIAEAVRLFKERPAEDRDGATLDQLMKLWCQAEVLRLTNIRAGQNRKAGNPGPEGSIAKLGFAEANKAIYAFCMNLLGAHATIGIEYSHSRSEALGLEGPPGSSRKMFLRSRANSIEGGTSEIMRNILGERVLGLPGEPRMDKDLPWVEVPRN